VQTFLPYADPHASAEVLDKVRRWKQVVEVGQLLKALGQGPTVSYNAATGEYLYGPLLPDLYQTRKTPYYGHPAAIMWRGRLDWLRLYHNAMLGAVLRHRTHDVKKIRPLDVPPDPAPPAWLGDERVHASHRAKLYWKAPDLYPQFRPDYLDCDRMARDPTEPQYFWPPADYARPGSLFE
jgi:hypothetical protein